MKEKTHRRKLDADVDRVCTVKNARGGLARAAALVAASITVALAVVLLSRAFERPADDATNDRSARGATKEPADAEAADRAIREETRAQPVTTGPPRVRRVDASPAAPPEQPESSQGGPASPEGERPEIDARDYIAALRASGETTGLAAFSPPGTRPPRPGIVVPDDYELPEGFMRHYQSTDDGRQLEPILTLAPGYELIDENGNPVALPQDRIVPPELAPPDLPVRILEIPSAGDPEAKRR